MAMNLWVPAVLQNPTRQEAPKGQLDDDERWEVLVLGYEWRRGRPKFKYIIIERENHKDSNPNTKTATRGGGGAVDGVQD